MTTTNRIKAGGLPPLQLHRAQPIDFVMSDEEEQQVRNGYDMAMKAVIRKPEQFDESTNSTLEAEYGAYEPTDWASFRPLVIAGLVLCIVGLFYWGFA